MNNNNNDVLKFGFGVIAIIVVLALGFQATGISIFGVNFEKPTPTPRPQPTSGIGTGNIPLTINTSPNTSPTAPTYPTSIAGTWEGTYRCLYEGTANVTLTISGNERINAVFSFSPNRDNPTHPTGSFNMTGTYDSREGIVNLEATTWIEQPGAKNAIGNADALTNSVMMDMTATVTETGARIKGTLDPVSGIDVCNRIEVGRVN